MGKSMGCQGVAGGTGRRMDLGTPLTWRAKNIGTRAIGVTNPNQGLLSKDMQIRGVCWWGGPWGQGRSPQGLKWGRARDFP